MKKFTKAILLALMFIASFLLGQFFTNKKSVRELPIVQNTPISLGDYISITGQLQLIDYETFYGEGLPAEDPIYSIIFQVSTPSLLEKSGLPNDRIYPGLLNDHPNYRPLHNISLGCTYGYSGWSDIMTSTLLVPHYEGNSGFTFLQVLDAPRTTISGQVSALSGKIIELMITRPMNMYNSIRELPDRARPGDCVADSQFRLTNY